MLCRLQEVLFQFCFDLDRFHDELFDGQKKVGGMAARDLVFWWQHDAAIDKPDRGHIIWEIAEGDFLPGDFIVISICADDFERIILCTA